MRAKNVKKTALNTVIALAIASIAVTSIAAPAAADGKDKKAAASRVEKSEPAGHAAAFFIEQYDSNGDGKVELVEFEQFRGKRYAETDANRDGGVDLDEYVSEYAGRHDRQLEAARKAQIEQTHTRFRSVDKDGDGFISRAEYDASGDRAFTHVDANKDGRINDADPEPAREERQAKADDKQAKAEEKKEKAARTPRRQVLAMPSTHTRAGMLEIYDTDGDGVVTREEFDRQRDEAFKRTDTNGDGRIDADEYLLEFEDRLDRQIAKTREAANKQSAVRFKALDTDEDGRISPAEYAASGKRMFDRLDTNKDGVVSLDDPPPPPRETTDGKKSESTATKKASAAEY
jgi:Ca2+-binding EF-hand superfamily protein